VSADGTIGPRAALWLVGPPASGKSRIAACLAPLGFHRVDQDARFEAALREDGRALDVRADYDRAMALRRAVTDAIWAEVPGWRAEGRPLLFETTGDKPPLFSVEIERLRADGYRLAALLVRRPLHECLARNRARERVLPDGVVERAWAKFERNLADGVYARMFAGDPQRVVEPAGPVSDLAEWTLAALAPAP